jgi:AcrR family transcriptional regulator
VGDSELVEKRRAQIVEAATRLVARQGFGKTVVRDIAEEANFSVGLVYEYVRSKEDILFLIYEHWSAVWEEGLRAATSVEGGPIERLHEAIRFLVKAADENREVTTLFYREAGNLSDEGRKLTKDEERKLVGIVQGLVHDAVGAGLLRPGTDELSLALSCVLLSHGWVLKGYLLHQGRKPAAFAEWILDTLVRGCATPAGVRALERATAPA